jgi:hypothetical protein
VNILNAVLSHQDVRYYIPEWMAKAGPALDKMVRKRDWLRTKEPQEQPPSCRILNGQKKPSFEGFFGGLFLFI